MTYTAQSSLSRATAAVFTVAIHATLGLALFATLPVGTPDSSSRAGERGQALVIELLPLPEGGAAGKGPERRDRLRSDSAGRTGNSEGRSGPQSAARPPTLGAPPPGSGTAENANGVAGLAENKDGAPTLSGAELLAFRARLLRHIERFRRYPDRARAAGQEGVVRIQFVMNQAGDVTEAWVELSSGSGALDQEAIAAVRRAQPLPTPPSGMPQSFGVALPIGFALQ